MVSLVERQEHDAASWLFVHGAAAPRNGAGAAPLTERASERALVLARPQDIVCVSEEVEPAYLAYLAELGLGPSPERVVPASRFGDRTPRRRPPVLFAGHRLRCGSAPRRVVGPGEVRVVVLGPTRDAVLRASGELQSWCRLEGR